MSSPNPNWGRWTFTSFAMHFEANIVNVYSLPMHIEGQHQSIEKIDEHFELRLDGPYVREQQKNHWKLIIEVNCLVSTGFDDKNFYRHRLNCDRVTSAFKNCIGCYKYGKEVEDDKSLVGTYYLRDPDDTVEQAHFGQIHQDVQIQQSTVEGHYVMELET